MSPKVGLFGLPDDPHVRAVEAALGRFGAEPTIVHGGPAHTARWRWHAEGIATADGVELCSFDAVYVRSLGVPLPAADTTADGCRRAHARVKAAHAEIGDAVPVVVNPADAYWYHRSKPAADAAIAASGLVVPDSLATSDPAEVFEFTTRHQEVVYKPVAGGGACRMLTAGDTTAERLGALSEAPVYFQERIRGDDLRVYVLGGRVVGAAHIVTDAVDYRGHEDAVVPIDVDDVLARTALLAAAALGLVFSGVDVKRRADGSLVVLDANPSPMFLGIERHGVPVSAALAGHLLGAEAQQ